ncbi:MAG: hypothetical protein ACHQUB_01885 [Candidatus Saccharimonadia bacterium]
MFLFTRRNFLGALLFMLLVGEFTVHTVVVDGFFGMIGLYILYLVYFPVLDAIIAKYNVSVIGIILINFALYSILITGLLHGELGDYVRLPQNDLMTTLIHLQSAVFPIFSYLLLARIMPKSQPSYTSLRGPIIAFVIYVLLFIRTSSFGLMTLAHTFALAPFAALLGVLIGGWAFLNFHSYNARNTSLRGDKELLSTAFLLGVIALVPSVPAFVVLLLGSLGTILYILNKPNFRDSGVI